MRAEQVRTGASIVAARPELIGAGRFGLLTNFTGIMPDLTRTADALLAAGVNLTALFGPEHGLRGTAQAGAAEDDDRDERTGLGLFDTYLASGDTLDELIEASGIDTMIVDMQDVGVRFYTYLWSMYDCMLSAARTGRRFVVLDRPNPLGGQVVSGPGLDVRFASFVGRMDVPLRHGLTAGEMARLIDRWVLPEQLGHGVDLQVIALEGWRPCAFFDETGLPWVPPSPNMPTVQTALAYCGTGLFEGTNLSEGRGTTTPFEVIGAPYVDGRLIDALRERQLPGVAFRETWFVPTFHKYAGQSLRGVHLHVTDRHSFDPIGCAVAMIDTVARLYPQDFSFRVPGERVDDPTRGFAIDRLWGSDALRLAVASGAVPAERAAPIGSGAGYPENVLLYPRVPDIRPRAHHAEGER